MVKKVLSYDPAVADNRLHPIKSGETGYIDGSLNIAENLTVGGDRPVSGSVANMTALRGLTGSDGEYIYLQSHTTAGDGGQGNFRWVSGASPGTYTDNNGTIIVPTGGDGSVAWLRDYSGAVNVRWFGAKGDNITDDTSAFVDMFSEAVTDYFIPAGTYLTDNITLPNRRCHINGAGQYQTVIKPVSGGVSNSKYLWASSAYVNNSTFGSEPLYIENIAIDGGGSIENPLVIYGYFTEVHNSRLCGTSGDNNGASLLVTSNGISGSACSTTLVENKIINCRLDGEGAGRAFSMIDSGAKCTDQTFVDNLVFGGGAVFTAMAGHCVQANHFYAGSVYFAKLSIGTIIDSNYFENGATLDDFRDPVVGVSNNRFNDRLTVSFGSTGLTCHLDGNIFNDNGDILHDFFSASRKIYVNGGAVEKASPVAFSNGSSTGAVSFDCVYNHARGYYLSGSRTALTGAIYAVSWGSSAPASGSWVVGDTVINTDPESGGPDRWRCTSSGTPGTWVPVNSDSTDVWTTTSAGGPTSNYTWVKRVGRVGKSGDVVSVWFYHEWTSSSVGTGDTVVGVLPYAAANITDMEFSGVVSNISSTAAVDQFTLFVAPGSTALQVRKRVNGAASATMQRSDWATGTNYISGQITYLTE